MRNGLRIVGAAAAALTLVAEPALAQMPEVDDVFAPWNKRDTAGCALGVESPKGTIFKAYGMANLEHDVANTPATVFELGSVSKQFTAAAVLLLAQDGKLRLDDDVRKYLPELPAYGSKVTIDHLLTHTSGLRDWGALGNLQGWGRTERTMTQDDVLALTARQRALNFRPGDEYLYSNTNYTLLATIVERVSGQVFAAFTRDRIFTPLGMRSTGWRTQLPVKGRATAYGKTQEGYAQQMPLIRTKGEGGVLSTVGDLLLWNRALTERKLGEFVAVEFERRGTLNDGRAIRYARGLRIGSRRGLREVSHGGATSAYKAWLGRFPEAGLSIAVVCNASDVGSSGASLGLRVADRFLPAAPTPKPGRVAAGRQNPGTIPGGMFVNQQTGLPLTLAASQGGLTASPGAKLTPAADGGFRMGGSHITFDGANRFQLSDVDGNVNEYRRTEAVTSVAPKPYLGRYVSEEVASTWFIQEGKDGLSLQSDSRPGWGRSLRPSYRDVFLFDTLSGVERDGIVRFKRDAKGNVNAMEIGWGLRLRALRLVRAGD